MKINVIKYSLCFLLIFFQTVNSQEKKDSLLIKNSLKLDLFSIYNSIFDNRIQLKAGIDYERIVNEKEFLSFYLTIGVFDKYIYRKYYNFFNEVPGFYYIEQEIIISGFHFIPVYNRFLFQSKQKSNQGLFAGGAVDLNLYFKKHFYYNSFTVEQLIQKYNQFRLAFGLNIGWKYKLNKKLFVEFQTSFFTSVLKVLSKEGMNSIRPLNSQWCDLNYYYWWASNLKLCYAFK